MRSFVEAQADSKGRFKVIAGIKGRKRRGLMYETTLYTWNGG